MNAHAQCPAAALIPHLERLIAAEEAADAANDDDLRSSISDVRDELSNRLPALRAQSPAGAAVQLCAAFYYAELTRGCSEQSDRDAYHTKVEALLKSALVVIDPNIPESLWEAYVGGELLKTFDGRPANAEKQNEGDHTLISRREAAQSAGLSTHQQVTAVRVANVPREAFEAAIEALIGLLDVLDGDCEDEGAQCEDEGCDSDTERDYADHG